MSKTELKALLEQAYALKDNLRELIEEQFLELVEREDSGPFSIEASEQSGAAQIDTNVQESSGQLASADRAASASDALPQEVRIPTANRHVELLQIRRRDRYGPAWRLGDCLVASEAGSMRATLGPDSSENVRITSQNYEVPIAAPDLSPGAYWTKGLITLEVDVLCEGNNEALVINVCVDTNRNFDNEITPEPLHVLLVDEFDNPILFGELTPNEREVGPVEVDKATLKDFVKWECRYAFGHLAD